MTEREALKLALEALESCGWNNGYAGENQYFHDELVDKAITAIKEALAQPEQEPCCYGGIAHDCRADENCRIVKRMKATQPEQEPVAWKYDVTHNQDGTVSVALPDGDELRIVLPNQQEPYCWTWDEFVSGGKWRAEYGWKKPTKKVVNLQPLYTTPPQRKPLTDEEKDRLANAWFSKDGDTDVANRKAIALIEEVEAAHGIKAEA